jgi:hypothetical protein
VYKHIVDISTVSRAVCCIALQDRVVHAAVRAASIVLRLRSAVACAYANQVLVALQ